MTTNSATDDDWMLSTLIGGTPTDTAVAVRYLKTYVKDRNVLEFGVGTGRVAIPLAGLAKRVVGIDISSEVLECGASKELPQNVTLIRGDAATWASGEQFDVVLCMFNFLMLFTSQEDQLSVICNAAKNLSDGGYLVVENAHPPLRAIEEGERVTTAGLPGANETIIVTQIFDWKSFLADQRLVHLRDGSVRTSHFALRMIHPPEQDLMAQIAGLRLCERMADWRGTPWRLGRTTPGRSNVISVYQKPSPVS